MPKVEKTEKENLEMVKGYEEAHEHFVLAEFEKLMHKRGMAWIMKEMGGEACMDMSDYIVGVWRGRIER